MNIHEYQGRKILADYGVPVSRSEWISSEADVEPAFRRLDRVPCMGKVQVLMGGRGKAGGVQRLHSLDELRSFVKRFLNQPFQTTQSAGKSKIVRSILLTEDASIREEYYLGVTVDRSAGIPVILFSKQGGIDIEETALKNPGSIRKIHFSPDTLPNLAALKKMFQADFRDNDLQGRLADTALRLTRLFTEKDASILEINPLVLSEDGRLLALDAKINFDDNALFRHEALRGLKDPDEENDRERKAKSIGLSYISMEGNVGCLVNGAGLAMATMDMIQLAGGSPANFLDVGGGASADQVREGFKIILEDPRVRSILLNVFGGIMKCDVIAEGVIEACREVRLHVPLIVRLEGTRVEEGRALLKKSDLNILSCRTIQEAAETAVQKARENSGAAARAAR